MDILINVIISLATGVLLWFALPRGAVLTKRLLDGPQDWDELSTIRPGDLRITNDSAVPIRLVSVTSRTALEPEWVSLDSETSKNGQHLWIEDEVDNITMSEQNTPWSKVTILPGDALRARVQNFSDLLIRYRRAGLWGHLEHRSLHVRGGV